MIAVLLLAVSMPPYQNPDEPAHFARADQIANGDFVSHAGDAAQVDSGVDAGALRFADMPHHPEVKAARARYAPLAWGARWPMTHGNTAMYPPFFYAPAAAAIWVAKARGFSVLPAMTAARAATGLASVAIGAVAIALAETAALWLFAVLALPMSLAEMAAVGQDGPMIACSALAASLAVRIQRREGARWGSLCGLCLLTALIGMARPPYAPFALLLLLAAGVRLRWRALLAGSSIAMAACWCLVILRVSGLYGGYTGADAGAQWHGLLTAPWRVVPIAWETLWVFSRIYAVTFIGMLGWMDVELPDFLIWGAAGTLALALGACVLGSRASLGARGHGRRWLGVSAIALLAAASVFAAQYLTWTPLGASRVEGVQGRYFLPVALVLGAAVAGQRRASRLSGLLAVPVVVFPAVTLVVSMHAVVLRYYLKG